MQKRSRELKTFVSPVGLDPSFPICGGDLFIQTDRPITYLHVHECVELGYCYSGGGIFIVGEKVLPYEAGDVICIPTGEVHLASSAPGTESRWSWVYFDPARLIGLVGDNSMRFDLALLAGSAFQNVLSSKKHPEATRVILRMIEELQSEKPGRKSALRALGWELLVLLQRLAPRAAAPRVPRPDYERLIPALNRMSSGYARPISMRELARACSLSEPHFRRLFKAAIGRSPRAYWNDLRLQTAASLLRGSARPVLEISQDVGFETISSFNRLFKAHFGQSPRSWRYAFANS